MNRQSGSIAIPALITTLIGVSFALMFTNLTRYIQAKGTVESASRAALRCLVPTDGGCADLSLTAPTGRRWQWRTNQNQPALQASANLFQYTASVEEESWQAEYTSFVVPTGSPLLSIPTYSLPVRRFTAPLAREVRYGVYERTIQHQGYYRPAWFPSFAQSVESGTNGSTQYNERQWLAAMGRQDPRRSQGEISSAFERRTFSRTINAGQTATFSTGNIRIPELTPRLYCISGEVCSLEEAGSTTGRLSGQYRWDTHSLVAVKVFAEVEAAPGQQSTQVRWARDLTAPLSETNSGLYFRTGGQTRSLGGREISQRIGRTPTEYPLWLRGPAGSVGSTADKSDHSGLMVRRGDTFSISGYLTASAPARVNVTILYFFDSPKAEPGAVLTAKSPEEIIPVGSSSDYCPPRSVFGMPTSKDFIDLSCKQLRSRRVAGCGLDPKGSHPLAESRELQPEHFVAQCSAGDSAQAFSTPQIMAPIPEDLIGQNILCGGWTEDPAFSSSITLPGNFASCPLAKLGEPTEVSCNTEIPSCGGTPGVSACQQTNQIIQASNGRLASLHNGGAHSTSPRLRAGIGTLTAFDTTPLPFTITGTREYLSRSEIPAGVESCITEQRTQIKSSTPIYRSTSPLPLKHFNFPSHFSDDALRGSVTFTKLSSATKPIRSVYPFNTPETIEIGKRIPGGDDSNPICVGEGSFEATLEERLRFYASKEIKEVSDIETFFNYTVTPKGTTLFPPFSVCGSQRPPLPEGNHDCSTFTVVGSNTLCPTGNVIGVYADGVTPPQCVSSPQLCTKEVIELGSDENGTVGTVNSELAAAVAHAELRRAFPNTSDRCADSGCATVTVADTSGSAEVEVSYQVPLTWPLSDLLGKDSIPVSAKRVAELAATTSRR